MDFSVSVSFITLQVPLGQEHYCFCILYHTCSPQLNTMLSSSVNAKLTEGRRHNPPCPRPVLGWVSCGAQEGALWTQLQAPRARHYKPFSDQGVNSL